MMGEMTLPERLRVAAALNPDGFSIHLSRDAALHLVKVMEERERVAQADKWVHNLLADREEWFQRKVRDLNEALWGCMAVAGTSVFYAWLIAGWI